MSRITAKDARALTPTIPGDDEGGLEPDDLLDSDSDSASDEPTVDPIPRTTRFCLRDDEVPPWIAASEECVEVLTEEGWQSIYSRKAAIKLLGRTIFNRLARRARKLEKARAAVDH